MPFIAAAELRVHEAFAVYLLAVVLAHFFNAAFAPVLLATENGHVGRTASDRAAVRDVSDGTSSDWSGRALDVARRRLVCRRREAAELRRSLSVRRAATNDFAVLSLLERRCAEADASVEQAMADIHAAERDMGAKRRRNATATCLKKEDRASVAAPSPRAHRCRVCGGDGLIKRKDHHCVFLPRCIGAHNHAPFIFFQLTLAVGVLGYLLPLWRRYRPPLADEARGVAEAGGDGAGWGGDTEAVLSDRLLDAWFCRPTLYPSFEGLCMTIPTIERTVATLCASDLLFCSVHLLLVARGVTTREVVRNPRVLLRGRGTVGSNFLEIGVASLGDFWRTMLWPFGARVYFPLGASWLQLGRQR
jgi:hypothetical protein